MELNVKEFKQTELITIQGRVDSVEASQLVQALEAANHRGKHKLVVDMSRLEYMSSAGFRALAEAQRNSKRHKGGEVVLAQVPARVHEALEMVGFDQYFTIFDDVTSALEFAENLPAGDPRPHASPPGK
jgi:anti-sigma B factor antagonist